jgi:hypothetical protein
MFVVKHKDLLKLNTEVHGINTREKLELHAVAARC